MHQKAGFDRTGAINKGNNRNQHQVSWRAASTHSNKALVLWRGVRVDLAKRLFDLCTGAWSILLLHQQNNRTRVRASEHERGAKILFDDRRRR